MTLRDYIRTIPDYPKPGIMFRDITTLLADGSALREAADNLAAYYRDSAIDKVAVVESRGFLVGGIVAYLIGAGLVIIRKKGKLPYATFSMEYSLEYGTDSIEMHQDAIAPGERVMLHDDLLATGGTMAAAAGLVQRSGGTIVSASFLVELSFLHGRNVLAKAGVPDVHALIDYPGEE
ncbi:MAG TPA: adenine phosphoribosyltransferase [Candidatus Kapabacteria bacterium]|nr:adenine phosphoribosyltransferase [Candidatus Kapabacteria bacterium]